MHKKPWFWFLAGWFLALVISPQHLVGMVKSKS